jgi:Protein of unknown function (DUF4233)
VRRKRSTTESLLSIVLLLEAILLFFVVLVLFGLRILSPALAFGGGAAFVVVILVTIASLRWPIGVAIGWVIQLALIALGLLSPIMYLIGAGFAAFWIWCFVRGRQIDHSTPPEGDTP